MERAALAIPVLAALLIGCGPAATSSTAQHRAGTATKQAPLIRGSNAAADVSSISDRPTPRLQSKAPGVAAQPAAPRASHSTVVPDVSGAIAGCGAIVNTPGKAKPMCAPG